MLGLACSSPEGESHNIQNGGPGGTGGTGGVDLFCFRIVTLASADTSRSVGDLACGLAEEDDYDGDGLPNIYDGTEGAAAGDSGNFASEANDGYYEIANLYQLQAIMTFQGSMGLTERLSANYRLVSDIDASITASGNYDADFDGSPDSEGFQPLGDNTNRFMGNFDGNGHRISNLTINRPSTDYVGLFGVSENSDIENVHLDNLSISAASWAGALVAYKIGGSIEGSSAEGSLTSEAMSGGLVGENTGAIQSSFANVSVIGTGDERGGLVGDNSGTVQNSYAAGLVSTTDNSDKIGGLAGTNSGTIQTSYASGNTRGEMSSNILIGGLVGDNFGSIANSYAAGEVRGQDRIGGLVGLNSGTIQTSYSTGLVRNRGEQNGGLVGEHSNGSIERSYTASQIRNRTKNRTGGLIGESEGSITEGPLYFAANTSPAGASGIGYSGASCDPSLCIRATGSNYSERYSWLEDSLDETLDTGLNWDAELDSESNAVWGNLNAANFPCLRNMPTGAPACD